LTISALGVYANEILGNITVGIYSSTILGVTSGSSLASATFNSSSLGTSSGDYNYKNTSLNLDSGTTYALVTSYTGGGGTSGYYSGDSGDITVYSGPLLSLGNLYRNGSAKDKTAFGSGNMSFKAFVPVPEMGLFGVAGVGLLGMVYVGRGLVMKRQNGSA
jgi:hypothetical protein